MQNYDAIVIGAGQGGSPLAHKLADLRQKVALIEREHLGGSCINYGCTPTKTMVASARVAHYARRGPEYGVKTGEISIDFAKVIARKIGQETPLPSLELATEDFTGYIGGCDTQYSCAYMNTISWSSATTPVPMEINPRVVFERMFGRPGTAAQRQQRMQTDKSILDSLTADVKDLERGLGARDLGRLSEYLEHVREIERRIEVSEKAGTSSLDVDAPAR